jgi:hypothetical protein
MDAIKAPVTSCFYPSHVASIYQLSRTPNKQSCMLEMISSIFSNNKLLLYTCAKLCLSAMGVNWAAAHSAVLHGGYEKRKSDAPSYCEVIYHCRKVVYRGI